MNRIQCYKVEYDELNIAEITRSKMKELGYYESPIDAINDSINIHRYWLSNEEHAVQKRMEVISKLEKKKNDYLNGKNIFD